MRIISYSLWGDNPRYTEGMIANAELAHVIYPDWTVRVYIENGVKFETIKSLKERNCQLISMDGANWIGMFWRFLAADSDHIVISRDADSRLTYREKFAVDEWLESDKDFHIMRDHPYHGVPILGGMWGARNGVLKGISEWIKLYQKEDRLGIDQDFLEHCVYPQIKDNTFVHDEFYDKKPFPTIRDDKHFVGQAYAGDGRILDGEEYFKDYFNKELEYVSSR